MAAPRKPDDELHTHLLHIRLTAEQMHALKVQASIHDLPKNTIGRLLLLAGLEEDQRKSLEQSQAEDPS